MSQPNNENLGAIQQQLENYLPHLNADEEPFSFYELCGFLLAVCSSPELIKPSEWLPVILGDDLDVPESLGEPQEVLGVIMDLYNWVNFQILTGKSPMPPQMQINTDEPFANFGAQAHVGQWCKGFYEGHEWLREVWDHFLDDELEEEISSYLMPLTFFLDENFARALYEDFARQDKSFAEITEYLIHLFPHAALDYANLGRTIAETLESMNEEIVETVVYDEPKVGRNDPCPCGSGKKYKKCCLH